jgi:AcrR family transcriptional regulator
LARSRTNTPIQPDDPRAQRSIAALREALLELLQTRRFDQIEIKHITDGAGVSYRTFFRRFANKEELLEEIAAGEAGNLLMLGEAAMAGPDPESSVSRMCEYVENHRKLWTVLLTGGAASAMREEFMRIAREHSGARPRINPWLPLDLAVTFVANGIFDIFAWWMIQPEDYPISNVVKLFKALIVDTTAQPRDITLD